MLRCTEVARQTVEKGSFASSIQCPRHVGFAPKNGSQSDNVESTRWADSVEKVQNPKSLQICQNTNDIFD
jgi:hypothetical protein